MNAEYFARKLKSEEYAPETVTMYCNYLKLFLKCIQKDIRDVTAHDLFAFGTYLQKRKTRFGKIGYDSSTIQRVFSCLKRFFTYLVRDNKIMCSPFEGIDLNLQVCHRMRDALSLDIIMQFLESINGGDLYSLRDRAVCEMLYGTGMRLGELCNLHRKDVDLNGRVAYLKKTKNGHDRLVPLGSKVVLYLQNYCSQSFPSVLPYFFLSNLGYKLSSGTVNYYIKKRLQAVKMQEVRLTAHIFRHSFATHMLQNGAQVRYVQEILGHESLESTVRYTHFDVTNKRKMMKIYHPLENELSDLYEDVITYFK